VEEKKQSIVINSDKEKGFINEIRCRVGSIVTFNIANCEILKHITQKFTSIVENIWNKFSK